MPMMYCPQCGRELILDSGEVRFCRYCGFHLLDTKEALHGYSEQKRTGFSIVTWCYALLLIVTLLLHGRYIPLDTGWGYWVSAILIVISVSLFASASVSALKPALFSKGQRGEGTLGPREGLKSLGSADRQGTSLPSSSGVPVAELREQERRTEKLTQRGSVVEGTTRRLED